MIYDYSQLNEKITEKCGSQSKFAEEMHLSQRSISLKLNNKRTWKQSEMLKASKILGISINELHNYFLTVKGG